MSSPFGAAIEPRGMALMGNADDPCQRAPLMRQDDQVHVVRHQTVGPQLELILAAGNGQVLEIARAVRVVEEDGRGVVSTVHHVQWNVR